ncbi:MAG: S-layer homology domain-containing protein [Leptolyngbya sp. RL_3_1]|nr:S-layer homology domain-containing protein [Leptolyngbya sp. RL_3_1]
MHSIHTPSVILAGMYAIALPGIAWAASSGTGATMAQLVLPDHAPADTHTASDIPMLSEAIIPPFPGTDISAGHWAYSAVDNLANTYGCINGYPDDSFRGDQAITRDEFAAALSSCLGTLVQLTQVGQGATLDEILADLNRLQQELGSLDGQIDGLQEAE